MNYLDYFKGGNGLVKQEITATSNYRFPPFCDPYFSASLKTLLALEFFISTCENVSFGVYW